VNYDAWGALLIAWGTILLVVGAALNARQGWARWAAVVIASLNILIQIGFLAAYPIWSALIIAFDVLVIFALTARWAEARRGLS